MAIAFAGGVIAAWIGLPVPYMLGSVGLTLLAALCGAPLERPGPVLVLPMRVVLGVLLGSTITPELVRQAAAISGAAVLVPLYVGLIGAFGLFYYRKVAGLPWQEAFFAGLPGGIYSMTAFAEESGVDVKRIALAHALRITIVIVAVPWLLYLLTDQAVEMVAVEATYLVDVRPTDFLWFGVAGVVGSWLGRRSGLPGGLMIVPMVLSAAFRLAGFTHSGPPYEVVVAAQVILGAAIGSQFVGQHIRTLAAASLQATGYVMVSLLLTLVLAWLLNWWLHMPHATAVLAFAPGGIAEMTLLALGLGLNVGVVAVLQVFRILIVIAAFPLVFKILRGSQ